MMTNTVRTKQIYAALKEELPNALPYSFIYQSSNEPFSAIGLSSENVILLQDSRLIIKREGTEQEIKLSEGGLFKQIKSLLDPQLPCFFLISPDIYRGLQDPLVPSAIFIQPSAEIRINKDNSIETWYANAQSEKTLKQYVTKVLNKRTPKQPTFNKLQNNNHSNAWASEADDSFLKRLRASINLLQTEAGKMIISRTYKQPYSSSLDTFQLYDIYSDLEPNCAASHYANIGENQYSLGCSPENIFELKDNTLFFDVIASTRGVSADPEKNERWQQELLEDEKENTEHMMALNRYKSRMQQLCQEGEYQVDFIKKVRAFKHVKHLYSRLSGQLKPSIKLFDLLEGSYPPLNSYPDSLVLKADLRTEPFHFYGGMVGYSEIGMSNASCFLNIRAALLSDSQAFTQGGVGVIKDSQAESELLEVQNKLACLMEAFNLWQGQQRAS